MSTSRSHSVNGLETPTTSVPDSDENISKDMYHTQDQHQHQTEARFLDVALQAPPPTQNMSQPPPSTKRWTWELVSDEDGRPSKKRRQTSPILDPEALTSQGIRTRRMAKKGGAGTATPPEQPVEPTPKTKKRRRASVDIQGANEDVVLKRVKMANQPEQSREKNQVPPMTRPLARPKTKAPRVTKEQKKPRVTKPKTKVTRIAKKSKIQRPVKSKAKIAQARRRVRIAKSPSQRDETSSDDWQEDTFSEDDEADDYRRVGTGFEIGNCSSTLNSFRKVFSLSSIWPDCNANDVQNVLQRTNNAHGIREEAYQDPSPRTREGLARALTLHDIIPSKATITKKMADRMAQHDRILERKIREEEQRIGALTRDERGGGEVERMYAALAREMQSVPTTVAMQRDREAQEDASFHDNAFDISNAIPGHSETRFREKSVQSFPINMSGALPAPDQNGLDGGIAQHTTQDGEIPNEEAVQESRGQGQEIHNIEERKNPVPSHESPPKSPSQENTQHATGIQVIDISSNASESSADEVDRDFTSNGFARHDGYSSDDEVERDPARRDLAAYDKYMEEHDVEGDDEDEGEDEDNEPEDGDSEWEREEDLSSSDDVVDEESFIPGRYAGGKARRPILLRKMNNQMVKDQDLAGELST